MRVHEKEMMMMNSPLRHTHREGGRNEMNVVRACVDTDNVLCPPHPFLSLLLSSYFIIAIHTHTYTRIFVLQKDKWAFILIKGPNCFIFANDQGTSPKYAIELARKKAYVKDNDDKTVSLETSLGDVEYTFVFTTTEEASKFASTATKQAAVGEREIVRKVCPHETTLVMSIVLFSPFSFLVRCCSRCMCVCACSPRDEYWLDY